MKGVERASGVLERRLSWRQGWRFNRLLIINIDSSYNAPSDRLEEAALA